MFVINNFNGMLYVSFGSGVTEHDYSVFKNEFCIELDKDSLQFEEVTVGITDEGKVFIDTYDMHYIGDYVMIEIDMESMVFDLRYVRNGNSYLV